MAKKLGQKELKDIKGGSVCAVDINRYLDEDKGIHDPEVKKRIIKYVFPYIDYPAEELKEYDYEEKCWKAKVDSYIKKYL